MLYEQFDFLSKQLFRQFVFHKRQWICTNYISVSKKTAGLSTPCGLSHVYWGDGSFNGMPECLCWGGRSKSGKDTGDCRRRCYRSRILDDTKDNTAHFKSSEMNSFKTRFQSSSCTGAALLALLSCLSFIRFIFSPYPENPKRPREAGTIWNTYISIRLKAHRRIYRIHIVCVLFIITVLQLIIIFQSVHNRRDNSKIIICSCNLYRRNIYSVHVFYAVIV